MIRSVCGVIRLLYLPVALFLMSSRCTGQVLTVKPSDITLGIGDSPSIRMNGSILNNTPDPILVQTVVTTLTSSPPGLLYGATFDLGNYTAANGPITVNPGQLFTPDMVGLDRLFTFQPFGITTPPGDYTLGVALFTTTGTAAETSIHVRVVEVPEPAAAWILAAFLPAYAIHRARPIKARR